MKIYSEYHLRKEARFINKIWVLDNLSNNCELENLNILPNGCFNIGILIGNGALVSLKNKNYNVTQNIYLCSQFSKPVKITLLKHTKIILIQLYAWSFSYIPGLDFSNFLDEISESTSNIHLFDSYVNLDNPNILETTIQITERYFLQLNDEYSGKNIVEQVALKILSQKGNCKISEILNGFKYSKRWIQKKFKIATGLTPKQYAQITQFRDSVDKITYYNTNKRLTSITYDVGYSDQSHFIKNFRQFSNLLPSKFDSKDFILSLRK